MKSLSILDAFDITSYFGLSSEKSSSASSRGREKTSRNEKTAGNLIFDLPSPLEWPRGMKPCTAACPITSQETWLVPPPLYSMSTSLSSQDRDVDNTENEEADEGRSPSPYHDRGSKKSDGSVEAEVQDRRQGKHEATSFKKKSTLRNLLVLQDEGVLIGENYHGAVHEEEEDRKKRSSQSMTGGGLLETGGETALVEVEFIRIKRLKMFLVPSEDLFSRVGQQQKNHRDVLLSPSKAREVHKKGSTMKDSAGENEEQELEQGAERETGGSSRRMKIRRGRREGGKKRKEEREEDTWGEIEQGRTYGVKIEVYGDDGERLDRNLFRVMNVSLRVTTKRQKSRGRYERISGEPQEYDRKAFSLHEEGGEEEEDDETGGEEEERDDEDGGWVYVQRRFNPLLDGDEDHHTGSSSHLSFSEEDENGRRGEKKKSTKRRRRSRHRREADDVFSGDAEGDQENERKHEEEEEESHEDEEGEEEEENMIGAVASYAVDGNRSAVYPPLQQHEGERRRRRTRDDRSSFISGGDHRTQRSRVEESFPRCFSRRDKSDFPPSTKTDEALAQEEAGEDCPDFFFFANGFDADTEILLIAEALNFSLSFPKSRTSSSSRGGGISSSTGERRRSGRPSIPSFPYDISHRSQARLIASPVRTQMVLALYPPLRLFPSTLVLLPGGHSFQLTVRGGPGSSRRAMIEGILKDERGMKKKKRMKTTTEEGYGDERGKEEEDEEEEKREGKAERGGSGRVTRRCVSSDPSIVSSLIISSVNMISPGGSLSHGRASLHHQDVVGLYTDTKDGHRNDRNARGEDIVEIVTGREGQARLVVSVSDVDSPRFSSSLRSLYPRERIAEALVEVIVALPVRVEIREYRGSPSGNYYLDLPHESMMETLQIEKLRQLAKKGLPDETGGSIHSTGNEGLGGVGREQGDERMSKTLETMRGGGEEDRGQGGGGERERSPYLEGEENDERQGKKIRVYVHLTRKLHALLYDEKDREFNFSHLLTPTGTVGGPGLDLQTHEGRRRYQQLGSSETIPPPSATVCTYTWTVLDNDTETDSPPFLLIDPVMRDLYVNETRETCCSTSSSVFLTSPLCLSPSSSDLCTNGLPSNDFLSPEDLLKRRVSGSSGDMTSVSVVGLRQGTARLHLSVSCSPSSAGQDRETRSSSKRVVLEKEVSIEVLSSPLFSTRASLTSLAASSFVTPSPSFSSSFHRSPLHVRSPRACKEGLYASPACIRDSSRLRSDFFELDDRGRHEGLLSPPLLLAEFSEYRLPCCSVEIETRSEASFSSSPLDNKGDLHSSLPRSRISSSSSSSRSAPCPCPSNPSSPTTTVSPSEEEEEHSRPSYAYHRNSTNPHIDHSPGEDPSPKETKHHRSSTPAADRSPSACRCSDSSSPMAMNDEGRDMRRGGETSSFSSNISVLPGGQGLVTFGDHPGLFSRRAGSSPHSSSLDKEREMAFSVSSLRTSLVLTERKKMVSSSLGEGGISRSVHRRQGGREESLGRDEVDEGGEEDISHNKRRRGRRRRKTSYEEDDWWIGRVEVARVSSISLTKRRKGLPGSRREDDTLFQKGFPALATPSWSSSSLTTIKMTRGDIQQFEVVLHDVYGREILTPNDLRLDVFSSHPSMVSAEVGRHVDSSNMFAPPSIVLYASKVYEGCAAITVFLLSPSSSSGKDVSSSSSRVFLSDSLRVCVDNPSILGPSLPSLPSLEEAWYLSKSLSSFSLEKSSQKKNLDTHALSSSSFSFINIPFIPLFPGSTVRMVDSEKRRRDRGGIVAPTPPQLSIRLFFHLEPLLSSYLLAIRNERHLGEKLREGFFFSFHGNSDSMWVLSKDLRKVAEEILKSTLTTTFSSSSTRCLPISSVAKFTHLLSPYIAQSLHTSLSSLFFSLTSSSSLPFLYTPAFSIDEPLLHFSAIDSSSTTLKRSSSSSTLEYLFSRTQPSSFSPIPFCEVPGGSSSSVPISKGNEEGIRRPEAHAKTASSSSPSTPRFDLFPSSLSFRFSLHDVPGTLATWLLSEEEEERREKAEKHPRQEDEENHERGGGGEEQKNRRGIQEEEKKKKMVMIKQFLLRKDTTNELLNRLRRKLSDVWWREQRQMGERTALAYRRCRRKARDILKKRIEVENAREGQSSSMFSSTSSYYSPSRPETSHKKKRDEQERPSSEAPFSSPSSASSRRRERSEEDFGVLSRKKDFGRGRGGIGKTSSSLSLYCEKIADDLYTSSILSPLLFLDWSQGFSPSDPLLSSPSFFSSPSSRRDRSHSGSPGKHRSVSDSPSSLSSASSMQWSSTNDAILQVYTPSGGFRGSSSIPPSESEVYMKASRMRSERLKGANSHHLSDGITAVAAGAGRAQVLVRDLPILNIHVLGEDMIRKTSSSFVGETSLKEGKEEERRQKREEQKKSIRVIVAAGCAIGKQRWSSSLLQGGQEEERRRRTSEEEEEDVHDRALSIDFPPETAWMSLVDRRSEASDRSSSFSSSRREQEKREESPQSVSVSSMVSLPELQKAGKCRRSHSSDSKSNSFSFSFGGFKRTASLGLSERYEDDDEEEMEEGEGRDHSPLLRGTSDHHLLLFRIQADTSPPMRGLPSHGSFQSLSEGREVSRSVEERNEGYRSSSSFDRDQHEEKMKKKKNLKKKDSFQPDDEEPFEKESYEREKTGKKNEWRDVSTSVYITSSARVDCEIGDPYLAPLYTVESLKLPMKKTGGRRKERSELFSPTSFSPRGNGENLSNVKDGEERVFERKQQEEEKSSSSSFSEKILERADDKTVGSSDNAGGEDEVLTAQACTVRPRQTLSFEQDLPYLLALSRVVGAGKESSPSFMRYLDSERNPCAAAVLSSQTSHTHNKREDRRDEKDIQEEEEQTNSIATPPLFFSSSFSSSSDGVDEAASLSLPVSVRVSLGGGTLPLFSFSPSDLETAMMFATSSSSSSKMDMSIYQQIHHQARRRFFQSMRSTASQSLDENYSSRSPAMASPINSSLSGLPTGCIALPFKPHMRLVIGEKSSYLSSTTTLGEGRIVDIPGRGGVIFIKREQYFTHLFVNGKEEESERNRGDENTSPGEHGESGSKEEEADSRKEKERKEQEKKEEEEEEEDFFAEAQNHLGGWMNFMKEQEDLSSSQLGGRSQSTSSSSSFSGPMSHASRLDILRERSLREGAKLPVIFFVYPVPFGEERGGDAGAVLKENKRRAKGEKERERGQRLSVRVHVSSDAYRVRAQQRGPLLAVRVDAAAKRETAYNKEKEEEEAKGLQKGKRDKGVGEVNSKSRKRAEKDQKDLERESEEEEEEEEDDMDGASMWVAPSTAKITIECPVWKQTLSVSLDAGPEPLLKRNLLSVFSDSLFSQRYSHSEGRSETSRYWDLEEEDEEEEEDHEEEKDKGRRGTTGIFRMIWEWSIVVILLFGGLVFISRRDTFHSWMRWRRRPACSFIPASDRIYVPERSDLVSPHNVFSASSSVHPYSMGEGSPGSAPSSFLIREKARLEMARAADFHRSRLGGGDTHEYGMDDEGRSFLSYSCGSRSSGSASVGGGAAAAEPLPQKLQMQADGRWKWVSSQSEVASPPGKDTTKGTTVLRGMGGTSGGNTRRGRLD
ncbi:transmembrane protein [Cystoisospora suis]|uniref:Transmembrane protein n=1 Tax=Cystoisospora suis TaxID=483139 RepID=A0A2C6KHN2_9APIC|nr:transmembrane protein [Cystoisospora suis]